MNRYLTSIITLMAGMSLAAAPLSPEEALTNALSTYKSSQTRVARNLELAYTLDAKANAQPAVYVFAPNSGNGFVVVAADDAVSTPLLGYSDAAFDPDNIPPAMAWWLSTYADAIARAAASGNPVLKVGQRAARESIEPMVDTQWNQSAPYNNMCPIVNGQRSVTGCVATAQAQLMKVWSYPTHGVGSHGGVNFAQATYDWDNMTNTYGGRSTQVQKDAVALLMWHCGVACDMSYSPSGSGATDIAAAQALVRYFNYGKSVRYLQRNWYSADDWDEMVYNELYAGRPLMYCGDDGEVGHAFVCDGYSYGSYFHINWGWGGVCDGYFTLDDLYPYSQGIGGGSGEEGFNNNQSVIAGIEPPVGNNDYVPVMIMDNPFSTDKTVYNRATDNVTFCTNTYSATLANGITFEIAYSLISNSGTQYIPIGDITLDIWNGFGNVVCEGTDFPVGSYDVEPVCRINGGPWYRILQMDGDYYQGYVHFDVTESTITVTGDAAIPEFEVRNCDAPSQAYQGQELSINATVESSAQWKGETYAFIYEGSTLRSISQPVVLAFNGAGVQNATWQLTVPQTLTLGNYYLGIGYVNPDNTLEIIHKQSIKVVDNPNFGAATVTSILFPESTNRGITKTRPALIDLYTGAAQVNVSCSLGPWSETVGCAITDANTGDIVAVAYGGSLSLQTDETGTVSVKGPWTPAEIGVTYGIVPYCKRYGVMTCAKKYYISFDNLNGVSAINADDDDAPEQYFNLQGIAIDRPTTGQVVIRRKGATIDKIIAK